MPVERPRWLNVVAAARQAGADNWSEGNLTVGRLSGGYNNALYRVTLAGAAYACKLCVADERQRAEREYGALRLLRAAGLEVAPQPLCLDESRDLFPYPVVVYRWLPGERLSPPLTQAQLAALLESVGQIHALRRRDYPDWELPTAWFHWFDFEPYLSELNDFVAQYGAWLATTGPEGTGLRDRLARLVDRCSQLLTAMDVDVGQESLPLCLCHVDQNLANAIWGADGRLRWIDWEFAGWGDPALDLAELRWHAALEGLSPAQQTWLRANYRRLADDPGFEARLSAWDHLIATRWPFLVLRVLWSLANGPDRLRLSQPRHDPAELRARLRRFVERAERFVFGRSF